MGIVHRPDDILNRRRRVEVALRDLNPGVRELVLNIVNSWKGSKSMEDLKRAVGEEKAVRIVEELSLPVDQ
ncbi:MAG: hypothetical protein HA496_05715 [Thaumarchaeota archaeon]|jgi:hypothetical protein|nr:hypothetical protein [Nitrososphaerota archaeon]